MLATGGGGGKRQQLHTDVYSIQNNASVRADRVGRAIIGPAQKQIPNRRGDFHGGIVARHGGVGIALGATDTQEDLLPHALALEDLARKPVADTVDQPGGAGLRLGGTGGPAVGGHVQRRPAAGPQERGDEGEDDDVDGRVGTDLGQRHGGAGRRLAVVDGDIVTGHGVENIGSAGGLGRAWDRCGRKGRRRGATGRELGSSRGITGDRFDDGCRGRRPRWWRRNRRRNTNRRIRRCGGGGGGGGVDRDTQVGGEEVDQRLERDFQGVDLFLQLFIAEFPPRDPATAPAVVLEAG